MTKEELYKYLDERVDAGLKGDREDNVDVIYREDGYRLRDEIESGVIKSIEDLKARGWIKHLYEIDPLKDPNFKSE